MFNRGQGQRISYLLKRGLTASCAIAIASALSATALSSSAYSQDLGELVEPDPDAQLLLQADELIYNQDEQTISAVGEVRIDYDGTRLVADTVTYDENTARVIAVGNVEILQPDGNRIFADEIDVTDDFRDGFVNSLRVVTPDNTRFGAESGERIDGTTTVFNNGFYTACEACKENPDKPVTWQVKAQKIIWNGEEKTVRFEGARFEFLGIPIAYLPVFTTADPTVRRKTGFLTPRFSFSDELGAGVSIPYFIALAPNMDLRLTGTGYSKQGFLGEAEFRHRLTNGIYTLKLAGIHQLEEEAFDPNTVDRANIDRGMIGTTGDFEINSRWSFGWDVLVQSDDNFAKTYEIQGFNQATRRDHVYLTGLGERSFFDAKIIKFDRQEDNEDQKADERDPTVLPTIDYNYIVDRDILGGQFAFNVNTRSISRELADTPARRGRRSVIGVEGNSFRTALETEWKRDFVTTGGLVLTPMLHAQGDIFTYNSDTVTKSFTNAQLDGDDTRFRGMVSAGLEARWPILFSTSSATHVLEPVGQIFVRPDETGAGELPNEDAQSFVFDTTNLFERDKFSGYDRIEGGTRANIGLRYNADFQNGLGLYAAIGQSYHLSGDNPFASPDFVNAGVESGLETDVSDVVAAVGLRYQNRLSSNVSLRFDKSDFDVQRADVDVKYKDDIFAAKLGYTFINEQPGYGFAVDRQEINTSGSVRVHDHWTLSGGMIYDLEEQRITQNTYGLMFDDECFIFGFTYTEDRKKQDTIERSVGFRLSLRTLGDFGVGSNEF
ncbi:MAG: LPS-assembly protein LptD [Pseudomonadota bacterium]